MKTHPFWILPLATLPALLACSKVTDAPPGEAHVVVSQMLFRSGSDSLEWMEIRNDGDGPATLAGIRIDAVNFVFPTTTAKLAPRGRLLLTNNQALFAVHHPGVGVAGVFEGRLSDEGEEVQLDGAEGKDFKFTFSDREPWPVAAAATGASLVYKGGDPELPESWGSSAIPGGAPRSDAATSSDRGVWISEVRPADPAGNGFVEIASTASEPIDLSGWIVAPSLGSSKSDTLAVGTTVPAHGRLVLRQTAAVGQLGWGHLLPSPSGGELLLVETRTLGLLGNVHSLAWKVVPEGMSVGRIGSTGAEPIALISTPTPGAPDAVRRLGLISVTEVCYAPLVGQAEFVELLNETDSVIHLGFQADSTRSWSLSGTGLTFASTDTLAPGGRMVLVSKDMKADAFRSQWKIAPSIPVLNFSGKLDNSGEILELRHPFTPVAGDNGLVEWTPVVEDAAAWLPRAPWPLEANGTGACLERASKTLPGTSPEAWVSGQPTPGK